MNSQISLHCRRQMQSRTQFHVKLKISTYEFHIINILRILRQFFFIHRTTMCLRKTKPLQLISHNFTNSQRSLTIFWHIDFGRKFLNWLRTSCVVSITTTATWHTWTTDFWADFEQRYHRQDNKRVAKRLWGCVNAERQQRHLSLMKIARVAFPLSAAW